MAVEVRKAWQMRVKMMKNGLTEGQSRQYLYLLVLKIKTETRDTTMDLFHAINKLHHPHLHL